MAKQIAVDRMRLAEYLKLHAETLAQQADLRVDVDEVSEDLRGGVVSYSATVRLSLEEIPLSEVEVQDHEN